MKIIRTIVERLSRGKVIKRRITVNKVIAQYKDKVSAIIIDDFRTFGTDSGFPSKSEIFSAIEQKFSEYEINIHLDQILITRKCC